MNEESERRDGHDSNSISTSTSNSKSNSNTKRNSNSNGNGNNNIPLTHVELTPVKLKLVLCTGAVRLSHICNSHR